jgi:hypothetical protein
MKDSKTVRVLKLVANDVAAFFPYFLGFYLISLCVSIFFPVWRDYFNWPAFHLSTLALALISLCSDTVQNFWKGVEDFSKTGKEKGFEVASRGVTVIGRVAFLFKRFLRILLFVVVLPSWKKFLSWQRSLGKSDYYKIAAMVLVLGFSLFRGIYVVDFFVLFFGLVSVLFGLDMRLSATCALALLVLCPFLLVFNASGFAETAAVYAYYFLVIAVLTAIGDYLRGRGTVMHSAVLDN